MILKIKKKHTDIPRLSWGIYIHLTNHAQVKIFDGL